MNVIKKIFRVLVCLVLLFSLVVSLYVKEGYKHWSITTHFTKDIEHQLSKEFGISISILKIKDYWIKNNLILSIDSLKIDKNYEFPNIEIKIDIVESIINNKITVSNIALISPKIKLKDSDLVKYKSQKSNNNSKFLDIVSIDNIKSNILGLELIYEKNKIDYKFDNVYIKSILNNNEIKIKISNAEKKDFYANLNIDLNNFNLKGKINGKYDYLYYILNNTPLDIYSEYVEPTWDISGDITLSLDIKPQDEIFDIKIDFNKNELKMNEIEKLEFSEVIGTLLVSSENKNIVEANFKTKFYGNTVNVNLKVNENGEAIIESYGYTNVDNLNIWLKNGFLKELTGGSIFKTKITLSENNNNIEIFSDLKGVKSSFPYPYSKIKDEEVNFIFSLDLDNKNTFIHYNDHNLKVVYKNNEISSILVGLNQLTPKPVESGIVIEGEIDKLNIKELYVYLSEEYDDESSNINLNIEKIKLKAKELKYQNYLFKKINLLFYKDYENNEYIGEIVSRQLDGRIMINNDGSYLADIDKLNFDIETQITPIEDNEIINLDFIKNGKLKIKNITLNNENLFDVLIEIPKDDINTEDDDLKLYIKSNHKSSYLDGLLTYNKKTNETNFKAIDEYVMYGNNIYDLSERTNPKSPATSENFSLSANLLWKGNPLALNPENLNGNLEFKMNKLKINGLKKDILGMKIFNLLNFDNILNYLTFDFSEVSNKEINFETVNLNYIIESGIMKSKKFIFKGDSAKIKSSGLINLVDKTIEKRITIELPVTNKLPVVSLIAGATPQTAGIFFVIDKMFGKIINKAFNVKMDIYGNWDDIKVKDVKKKKKGTK
jgi:uncharacterized protein YhdP